MKKYLYIYLLFFPFVAIGQNIVTYAGGGASGLGDGGPATSATIADPITLVFDKSGNCYIASGLGGNRIRKIDTAGIIHTVAGTGVAGYSGDGFAATAAKLKIPNSLALDTAGNLYICDGNNHVIRKIDFSTGVITTVAGTGTPGYNGDSISATSAMLNVPNDICFDRFNNLYIADESNSRIRKVSLGIITTVAGNGSYGFSGDYLPATDAQLWIPWSVTFDDTGNLYISDQSNFRIRKVNTSGIITTFAGNGVGVYGGDGIPATNASFNPGLIRFDSSNNLYIGDWNYNYRVLKVDNAGIIHSVAGNGTPGFGGDGGPATAARFNYPYGIALDHCQNLYITDVNPKRVRMVVYDTTCDAHGTPFLNDRSLVSSPLTIYPNPTTDLLHIDNLPSPSAYKILSLVGTTTQQGMLSAGNNTIPLSALPPGIYLLQVCNGNKERVIKKIIKQ